MKRICMRGLALLLTLTFVVSGLPFAVSAEEASGFVYTVAGGEATITDYKGSDTAVVIPDTLGGCPVTEIEAFAFDECTMTSVVIPGSVRRIGGGAFYLCENLETVTFSEGLEIIEETAFGDCISLKKAELPSTVNALSPEMFSGCDSLTSLTIKKGCKNYVASGNCIIETKTGTLIQGCASSVIPTSIKVKKIAAYAFAGVRNLKTIKIPSTVTEIGAYAFDSTALTELYIPKSVTKVGKYVVYYSSVKTVYCGAASKPSGWDSKWISGVDAEIIWNYCLHDSTRVVHVGPTCIEDGYHRLICADCGKLLSETTYSATGAHKYEDGVCTLCGKEAVMITPGDLDDNGKISIRDYIILKRYLQGQTDLITYDRWIYADINGNGRIEASDYGLLKLHAMSSFEIEPVPNDKNVEPTDYVGRYGEDVFHVLEFEEFEEPYGVAYKGGKVYPGQYSFSQALSEFSLKQGVTEIGDGAFIDCLHLSSIYIPSSVTYVGSYAFAYSGITDIYFQSETIPDGWAEDWLAGCSATLHFGVAPPCEHENTRLEVVEEGDCFNGGLEQTVCIDCGEVLEQFETPCKGHSEIYVQTQDPTCTRDGWRKEICGVCGTELIHKNIMSQGHDYSVVTVISQPTCTKSGLEETSCIRCGDVNSRQEIPAKGHTYGEDDRCKTCGSAKGDDISDFGYEITDEGVVITGYVGDKSHVKIPAQIEGLPVVKIADAAFEGKNFETVTLPATLREIGMFAFENCKNLKKISIPGSIKTIGGSAFMDCVALENLYLGEGVETLGAGAFSGCLSLTTVYLPASVKVLEISVFMGCDTLQSLGVAAGNTVFTSAGNCIIEISTGTLVVGCKTSVIPEDGSVTAIGAGAFECVVGLQALVIPDSVIAIQKDAFRSSGLEYLYIPETVETIGAYAFFDTRSLKAIYCQVAEAPAGWAAKWADGVGGEIVWDYNVCRHEYTFISSMREATCEEDGYTVVSCRSCGETVKSEEHKATGHKFDKNHKCTNCGTIEGLKLSFNAGGVSITGYEGNATALELPSEIGGLPVLSIEAGAFAGNDTLESVFIPSTVEAVASGAFADCEKLEEILCETESMPSTWDEDWASGTEVDVAWEAAPKPTILYGDVTGDTRIGVADYVLLKRHVMGTLKLTDEQLAPSDVNRDGKINTMDYVLLKRHVMGTFEIKQDQ